ncbi:hypothetical protein [Haloferula rosea]|uniref:Uncharacterized protein n=1 Tax=Haloferula rosea TaxID=490093 RepID=A0A934RAB3_9BACT|nr:hypothetical protein [Haloferula rosea]MBK1825699.1 hypothetical protein [Haloferula rosea]
MKTTISSRSILLMLGLWTAVTAQTTVIPVPDPTTGNPLLETLEAPLPDAAVDAAEAEPAEPEKDLAAELQELKFDRSPQAIFEVLRNREAKDELTPVEEFQYAVLFGDWKAVEATLDSLPIDKARPVYTKLISSLANQAVPVGKLLSEPARPSDGEDPYAARRRMSQQQQENREKRKLPAPILSEDFYGLVSAAPGGLTEDQLPSVAKLAEVALGDGGRQTLVKRLEEGWQGLGGDTKEGAMLATQLLSKLGWIRDAAPFLPLDEEAWKKADLTQLVYAMEYFTTLGIEDRDERQFAKAAEVCAILMKSSRIGNYTRPQFRLAMERLVALLPALEPDVAQKLIQEHLFSQRATLSDLIAIFGEQGQKASLDDDLQARTDSLGTQRLILDSLKTMEEALPPNVSVLVLNWLAEAEACYRAGGVVATEMTQAQRMMLQRYGMLNQAEVKTLATPQILESAPPLEIVERLNPGLTQRVRLTLLKLEVLDSDSLDMDSVRQYAEEHPGLERQICEDILAAWVAKQSKPAEDSRVKQMRAYGMYVPPQLAASGQSIPLTRLRQNQNIEELKGLLAELRGISPEPIDPSLVVEAFMALHSGAEVYQLDDIVAIFGPPESMVRAELLNLLEGMRARLGEEWQDPATQQQANTNRTKEETKDEVSRGYRTALELAKRGIPDDDSDWRALITRGRLFYDASQYEFDRQIKLTDYVDLRDGAFSSFRAAAETYAKDTESMPEGQWTVEPYQAWFLVMLGASDLAQLTSNTARTDPGLQSIGDAMRALPGEAAEAHLTMFGEMLGTLFPRVPANVRQRFLSSGLKIIGEDHPAAEAATRSLDYYRELLDEIQLRVTVDGPTDVGHGHPFGIYIGLESTRQLLRESGGYGKYLRGPGSARMGGAQQRDLRGDFERNIHAALDETFEVVSLTFHDSGVKPIPLSREGWTETPMVYAVLQAKNAAVDRIPSIQLDMDFVDQPGQVVLPVISQVQPINARPDDVPPRPCPELALSVTMDERDWSEGLLTVDISATGQGIIADLDECFEYQRDGFETEVVDGTLAIIEFVSDGSSRAPRADRNWQITYRRQPDFEATERFPLPQPIGSAESATLEYKLYRDTDLIDLDAEEAAEGIALSVLGQTHLTRWLLAAGGLLVVILLLWKVLRSRKTEVVAEQRLTAPENVTPFSTVVFLRRVRSEVGDKLSEKDREAITSQIREIETSCFGREEQPAPDLQKVVKQWQKVARHAA